MVGENLTKASEWLEKALKMEEEKKSESMVKKAMQKALELETAGLAAGETWPNLKSK